MDGGGMSCCFGRCHRHCFMHCWRVVHTNALPGAIQLLGVGKCAVPQNADRDLPLSLRVGVEKATQCWQGVANSGLEVLENTGEDGMLCGLHPSMVYGRVYKCTRMQRLASEKFKQYHCSSNYPCAHKVHARDLLRDIFVL